MPRTSCVQINDPEAVKPEDWDQPVEKTDANAVMPEEWDEDEDGEWEAPTIPNPEFKVRRAHMAATLFGVAAGWYMEDFAATLGVYCLPLFTLFSLCCAGRMESEASRESRLQGGRALVHSTR